MDRGQIQEDLVFYRDLERKIAASGKAYAINSGGGSRQWTNHDLAEIRKIIVSLENQLESAERGTGSVIGAGW